MDKVNKAIFDNNAQCCDITNNLIKENSMEKTNVAELLCNCPKGMELDCYLFNGLEFDYIDTCNETYPIICRAKTSSGEYNKHTFTKHGYYTVTYDYAKCVIFPKGKTTWEGFVPPCKFKNGDVVCTSMDSIAILGDKIGEHSESFNSYCGLYNYEFDTNVVVLPERFATEKEKQKLFDTIKANGYKWNTETKTLEKLIEPRFKVGDKIAPKNCKTINRVINAVLDDSYNLFGGGRIVFSDQDNWELVPDKFDISTLVPFESRVLVRDNVNEKWHPGIWGFYDNNSYNEYPYKLIGDISRYCIPYEGNEHLLGTTNDCSDYFKT